MAVAALSPWPTSPAALTAATAVLKTAIANDAETDATVQRVGAVAAERVERYAAGAPQATKNEAVIRFAGYLYSADFGAYRDETIGPLNKAYTVNHAPAWRNCGAAGLLAPWRVRRAGAIG